VKLIGKLIFTLFSIIVGVVIGVGAVGGIMYLNEKLNQFGTILIGG